MLFDVRICHTDVFFFFFFQAEDGIRDIGVTGVQTCALPISAAAGWPACSRARSRSKAWTRGCRSTPCNRCAKTRPAASGPSRSEERRVGKECRSRWSPEQQKKKSKKVRKAGRE